MSSIGRALDVMEAIRASDGAAGVSEISRAINVPKSTVHRILGVLADRRMVYKDEATDQYHFGYKALELGLSVFQGSDFLGVTLPHIRALRDEVDETVVVVLRTGFNYAYVGRAISHREYYYTPVMGKQFPLHWAATGKAMLAFLPTDDLERYLQTAPLMPATERTITDAKVLRDELVAVREAGYAVSFGERVEGAAAVASPLLSRERIAYGAVTVIMPSSRLRVPDTDALGLRVMSTCQDIESAAQMGGIDLGTVFGPD